jgi:hypothetical protein
MMGRRAFQQAAFKLGLMRKDMMLVLSESQELGVPMPVSESAYAMLTAATQQGLGDFDVAAILAFQERMTGMDEYPWPEPGAGPPAGMGGPPEGVTGRPEGMTGPPPGVTVGGGPPEGREGPP